jgi:hypothetical protein
MGVAIVSMALQAVVYLLMAVLLDIDSTSHSYKWMLSPFTKLFRSNKKKSIISEGKEPLLGSKEEEEEEEEEEKVEEEEGK